MSSSFASTAPAAAAASASSSPLPSAAALGLQLLQQDDVHEAELNMRGEEPRQQEHAPHRLMEEPHLSVQDDEPRQIDHDPQQPENEQQRHLQRRGEDLRLQGGLQSSDAAGHVLPSSREGATEGRGALHPTLSPQQRRSAMIECPSSAAAASLTPPTAAASFPRWTRGGMAGSSWADASSSSWEADTVRPCICLWPPLPHATAGAASAAVTAAAAGTAANASPRSLSASPQRTASSARLVCQAGGATPAACTPQAAPHNPLEGPCGDHSPSPFAIYVAGGSPQMPPSHRRAASDFVILQRQL